MPPNIDYPANKRIQYHLVSSIGDKEKFDEIVEIINLESRYLLWFQQAKQNVPETRIILDEVSQFFKDAFGVNDAEITLIEDETLDGCEKAYAELD